MDGRMDLFWSEGWKLEQDRDKEVGHPSGKRSKGMVKT